MSNEDDIIRNPARNRQRQVEPYKQEYKKLNVEPLHVEEREYMSEIDRQTPGQVIIKDDDYQENGHMIDNNENVFALQDMLEANRAKLINPFENTYQPIIPKITAKQEKKFVAPDPIRKFSHAQTSKPASSAPEVGEYILMVEGKMLMVGGLEVVQQRASNIIYGEDAQFAKEIKPSDIVVLKRVELKIGVFVGE